MDDMLSDEEIKKLSMKIAKHICRYSRKVISREIHKELKNKHLHISDYVNIVMLAQVIVDKYMLHHIREYFKEITNKEINLIKLMTNYIYNINTVIEEEEMQKYREKMN